MKICMIANASSIHTQRWLLPLIERQYDVTLISYTTLTQFIPGLKDAIDLTRLSHTPKLRWLNWGLWLRKYIRQLKPDVLHAHQVQAAGWLGYQTNFHPFIVSSWGSDLLIEPHKSAIRRLLVQLVLTRCDGLTVPSPILRQAALQLKVPEEKIRLIPWGTDIKIFNADTDDRLHTRQALKLPREAEVIFCPRGISRIYNIDIIISAIKKIIDQHPLLCLVLLRFNVDPKYMDEIQLLIQRENLNRHVHWLPFQGSLENMAHLYRMADIVISIPQSEGYGSSVYEALACGCPTIISDLPVFNNDLIHGIHTLKVPPGNINETSSALSRLILDKDFKNKVSQSSLEYIKNKSTQAFMVGFDQLYNEFATWRVRA